MVMQRNFELRLLWPIVLLGLCLWGFLTLAGEMMEGDLHAVDEWLLSWFRTGGVDGSAWGPRWLPDVMRDITALGSPTVLIMTVSAVCG